MNIEDRAPRLTPVICLVGTAAIFMYAYPFADAGWWVGLLTGLAGAARFMVWWTWKPEDEITEEHSQAKTPALPPRNRPLPPEAREPSKAPLYLFLSAMGLLVLFVLVVAFSSAPKG